MSLVSTRQPFIRLFGRYLRDEGLPVTHQREAIAKIVFESDEHLSVHDIEQALRDRQAGLGRQQSIAR
ncbi:MAG: hypothetical protein CM1200mP14_18390 [Gammaproteobacteria bacterium]|nr:MAG: hypothetical protein CM1200mP14_18390 [Gammaproteobacteria bacterium]